MGELPILAGRYQVLGVLGRGGMGEVFLAHDLRLDMDVAIKRVPPHFANDPALKAALTKEARILARLNNPHIVRIFDLSDTRDGLLLVMEYVCGPSLAQVLKARSRLTETELVHVMRDVAAAMTLAHGEGVIHRDLKPPNLLLLLPPTARMAFVAERTIPPDILDMQVKVADFGIAKMLETSTTGTNFATAGSPAYMAPEQYRGELPSAETDVYALGCIAYEVLSGQPPFIQGDMGYHHLNVQPKPLQGCSPRVGAAVLKALAKTREQRFHSAMAFLDALSAKIVPPVKPPQPEPGPSPWYPSLRVVVPLSLAIVIGAVLWFGHRPNPQSGGGGVDPPKSAPSAMTGLPPAPYVDQLPPIVEAARNPKRAEAAEVTGPRSNRIAWKTRVDIAESEDLTFAAAGADGNIYFLGNTRSDGMICALKDGKLLWGYDRVPRPYLLRRSEFDLDADGRIWMANTTDIRYCFNSRGQGGRLVKPTRAWTPPEPALENTLRYDVLRRAVTGVGYACAPDFHRDFRGDRPGLQGRAWTGGSAWFLPLDQPCPSETDPTVGPTGDAYPQTVDKILYHISQQGQVVWKFAAPCMIRKLYPLPSGDAVFTCGKDLYRVSGGSVLWKVAWDREFRTELLIDRAETVYALEEFNGGYLYQPTSHVRAIAANGQPLWDLTIAKYHVEHARLDAAGRLYLTGEVADGNGKWGIFCVSDQ